MHFVDLFCGCGGASAGFEQAGWRSKCGVDHDMNAINTYAANFPHAEAIQGDVTGSRVRRMLKKHKYVDVVFGGPPCQGFSSNTMIKTEKHATLNKLPVIFAQIAVSLLPRAIIMEEVQGASIVIPDVIQVLENAGYHVVFSRMVMASDYGVPQRRKRWLLVAMRTSATFALPPPVRMPISVAKALSSDPIPPFGRIVSPHAHLRILEVLSGQRKYRDGKYTVIDMSKSSRTVLTSSLPASGPFTIQRGNDFYMLSVQEVARLQSFSSKFKFTGSETSIRRQIGNAVPAALAKVVAEAVDVALNIND
jgi:DNA (cytosine-5)-methyltransferase 1